MREIDNYSFFINSRISYFIQTGLLVTPIVSRVIEKRDKALKSLTLSGIPAKEELFKKREEEQEKICQWHRNRHVQSYGTIYKGDRRLKAIARNEAKEAAIAIIVERRELREAKDAEKVEKREVWEEKAHRVKLILIARAINHKRKTTRFKVDEEVIQCHLAVFRS
jgi:16S rRNA C967 or C1407 C5-methylase (RsmB/RsmF family)